MTEKPKMFNRAIVFGSVLKTPSIKKTPNGKAYASVQLQCPNDLYGNLRIWGKVWGVRALDAARDLKPSDKVRMQGVLQQYEGEHGLVTNFNFFDFCPCSNQQAEDLRAVFILVGDVKSLQRIYGEERSDEMIEVLLEYQYGDGPPEEYRIYIDDESPLKSKIDKNLISKRVKFSGVLQQKESYFGETMPIRPFVKEMKIVWEPEETSEKQEETGGSTVDAGVPF